MERRKLTQFYSRNNNDELSSILSLSKALVKHLTDVGWPSIYVSLYWLMNKAVSANDLVEKMPCSRQRRRTCLNLRNLTGRLQSHGDTQIDRNGLI